LKFRFLLKYVFWYLHFIKIIFIPQFSGFFKNVIKSRKRNCHVSRLFFNKCLKSTGTQNDANDQNENRNHHCFLHNDYYMYKRAVLVKIAIFLPLAKCSAY